jgi:hypothetical protein
MTWNIFSAGVSNDEPAYNQFDQNGWIDAGTWFAGEIYP